MIPFHLLVQALDDRVMEGDMSMWLLSLSTFPYPSEAQTCFGIEASPAPQRAKERLTPLQSHRARPLHLSSALKHLI